MKGTLDARVCVNAVALTCCWMSGCHPTLILERESNIGQGGVAGSTWTGIESSNAGAGGQNHTTAPSNAGAGGQNRTTAQLDAAGAGGQNSRTLELAGAPSNTTAPSNAGAGGQNRTTAQLDAAGASGQSSTKARHVILLIGDGMQLSAEIATSRYLHGVDFGLTFHSFPVKAYQTTWSVDVYNGRASALGLPPYAAASFDPVVGYDPSMGGEAPYPVVEDNAARRAYFSFSDWLHPDSATTTTAIGTGVKTRNGVVAWDVATGLPLETSPERLRRLYGMSIGLASTIPFSHGRSAGFFAHNPSRENWTDIARELLTVTRPEVVISGGWNSMYYDPADLTQALTSDDTVFTHNEPGVESNAALMAAATAAAQTNRRLLAIYGEMDSLNVPIPSNGLSNPQFDVSQLDRPTLPNATLAALELLARDPDGLFLVIEQGQIDWATEADDFRTMIGCVWELDEAARVVTDFVDRPGDNIDWSNTTFIVTAGHANGYLRFGKALQQGELPLQVPSETSPSYGLYPNGEVSFNSGGFDTSELVMVYAKGFAANKLSDYQTPYPGHPIIDNTSLFRLTLDAAQR